MIAAEHALDAGGAPRRGRFRGWWMLACFTVALGLTAPGQTVGVSVFVDELIVALGLSRAEVSAAYLVGTGCGALALPFVGRWIDRVGVRHAMLVVGLGFGGAVAAAGAVQGLVTLALAFTGMRMLGQGALSLVGQTGIALWFDRRRGLAVGLATTASAAIMALAPLALTGLIASVGWRGAWLLAGLTIWLLVVPIARFAVVDRPSDIGQIPDGRLPRGESTYRPQASLGLGEAVRTPAFWSVTSIVGLSGCLVTALYFHQLSILGEQGLGRTEAAAVFLPGFVGTVTASFLFSWLGDRVSARILLPVAGSTLAGGLLLATAVSPGAVAALYGLLLGATVGQMNALAATVYPRWFGTGSIGAIRGVATSVVIAGSAVGPFLLAAGRELGGGYGPVLVIGAAVALAATVATALVEPPAAAPRAPGP